MSPTLKCMPIFRCLLVNTKLVKQRSNHVQLWTVRRNFSHFNAKLKPVHRKSRQLSPLLTFVPPPQIIGVAWASSSPSVDKLDPELGPLNVSMVTEELGKIGSIASPKKQDLEESFSITDIDLTDFTQELAETVLPEALLTASDVGLTWYCPTNLVFKSLMALHEHLPWCTSIAVLTLCVRLLMFPIMVKNMKVASNMAANVQGIQKHRDAFVKAKQAGDQALQMKTAIDLIQASQKNQAATIKALLPTICTGIAFSSNFLAIRAMANHPIESMKTGGLLWFPDLTVADPYYVLPIATSLTLYYVIRSGTEAAPVDQMSAKVLKIMPYIACPSILCVGIMFPAALNTYWLTNNIITLVQGGLLRHPKVRQILKIPEPVKPSHDLSNGPFHSVLELQQDIQEAGAIVKQIYQVKLSQDLKSKVQKMRQSKESS